MVLNSGLLRVWHGVCLGVAACPSAHYSRWFAHRAPVAASTPVGCCHRGATPTGENLKRKQRTRATMISGVVHSSRLRLGVKQFSTGDASSLRKLFELSWRLRRTIWCAARHSTRVLCGSLLRLSTTSDARQPLVVASRAGPRRC